MTTLNYFLTEAPLSKGKFMAKSLPASIYNEKEFISEMAKNRQGLTESNIKEVLKALIETAEGLLAKGHSITIPNFLKISPVVKGNFESESESFSHEKNWVGVNCMISTAFINNFQKLVKVEKITVPKKWPDITRIYGNKTKENVIQKNYANQIIGKLLNVPCYEFDGISLTSKADSALCEVIVRTGLDMISHKEKEMVFNIRQTFKAPSWLTEGSEIYVKLRYRSLEKNDAVIESEHFECRWSCVE